MNNCEIVDNVACGVSFQYCRTHKVEPKDCPGNAKPAILDLIAEQQRHINKLAAAISPSPLRREFRVGDKVRYKGSSDMVGVVVEGDVNCSGLTREKYEKTWGPAVLCDNGYFYRQDEMEHV